METLQAKELVVQAGRRLVETGLIVRTWGNVSCRINETEFAITPSGREYLSLTPEDIIVVKIADLSYQGDVRPSTEKGIHADVYRSRPDIGFVIHTHQKNASAVSAMGRDTIRLPEGEVICAAYGLPSTKKLRRGIMEALAKSSKSAIIMRNHGALCFGSNYEETFAAATNLEDFCQNYIKSVYLQQSGQTAFDLPAYRQFALDLSSLPPSPSAFFLESTRTAGGFSMQTADGNTKSISFDESSALSGTEKTLKEIYLKNSNIVTILHAVGPDVSAVSGKGIRLLPLLDDFAQIAGSSVNTTDEDPSNIASMLKNTSAVMIKNKGALCCGGSREDAIAVSLVMEKNCEAYIAASLTDKIKPINPLECKLMRFIYLRKYAGLANKK